MQTQTEQTKTEQIKAIADKFDKQSNNRKNAYMEKSRKIELFYNKGIVEQHLNSDWVETKDGKEKIEVLKNKVVIIDNLQRHKATIESLKDNNAKTFYKNYLFNVANSVLRKESKQ